MINSIHKYEEKEYTLALQDFTKIHDLMLEQLNDERIQLQYYDVLRSAGEYVVYRQKWNLLNAFQKAMIDDERTEKHDAFIYEMGLLSDMSNDGTWAEMLDLENRKRVGDFACWLMFVEGINAR